MSTPRLFAVFPYLKTHSRAVRGIEFRSVKDAEGLPADTAQRFETFREMFRYADGSRIADMTVAALPANLNDLGGATQLARLQQAHLLISYMYNGPQQGGDWFSEVSSPLCTCCKLMAYHSYWPTSLLGTRPNRKMVPRWLERSACGRRTATLC